MEPLPHVRLKENQNVWNIVFSVFFVFVLLVLLALLYAQYGYFPNTISLFDFILIILASFRLTRLVVYDKITRFFRELFVKKKESVRDGVTVVEITPHTQGFLGTFYDLLHCPWCVGMWSALVVTYAYYAFAWSWFVILFFAIAGVASFIQITANAIGWKAESLKHSHLRNLN